ncbi:unnamed protein product [Chrysodeixis includens]|uniref:Uncharacterized protein n=1 Tax=Chrysodeixis includens TaxID=689277 RepID=A0A9N8PX25_CHRIL|nr:unnamed protein product [Chrysodeixis includens]
MSQPRMRKVSSGGEAAVRARPPAAASGDSGACSVRPTHETQRSRSKNKIPKSVRYDLENALVSLCDVWFEEIKPHLLRNNIKLHVHGSAGGDHERPPPAPPSPPAPAPASCQHLDPGAAPDRPQRQAASYAGCCSTQLTVSRAPCRRPPAPSHPLRLAPPPSSSPIHDYMQTQSHNCEVKQLKRPRTRRKNRRSQPQPQSSWRVPRLCRTYSILSPAATGSRMRRIASQQPPPQPDQPPTRQNYLQFTVTRRNTVKKHKKTQTELEPQRCASVGCQCGAPVPALCTSLLLRRPGARARAASEQRAPRPAIYRLASTKPTATESLSLFQDDLIDIIGEKHDKRLRLLYSSPEKVECPSLMNLVPLPKKKQKPGGLKKCPPWR